MSDQAVEHLVAGVNLDGTPYTLDFEYDNGHPKVHLEFNDSKALDTALHERVRAEGWTFEKSTSYMGAYQQYFYSRPRKSG